MKRRVGHFVCDADVGDGGRAVHLRLHLPKRPPHPIPQQGRRLHGRIIAHTQSGEILRAPTASHTSFGRPFQRVNTPACAFLVGRPSLMRATAQMPSSISFGRFAKATRRHSRSRRRSRASSASRSTACCRGRCERTIMARRVRRPPAARVRMRHTTPRGMASSVRRARAL